MGSAPTSPDSPALCALGDQVQKKNPQRVIEPQADIYDSEDRNQPAFQQTQLDDSDIYSSDDDEGDMFAKEGGMHVRKKFDTPKFR